MTDRAYQYTRHVEAIRDAFVCHEDLTFRKGTRARVEADCYVAVDDDGERLGTSITVSEMPVAFHDLLTGEMFIRMPFSLQDDGAFRRILHSIPGVRAIRIDTSLGHTAKLNYKPWLNPEQWTQVTQ